MRRAMFLLTFPPVLLTLLSAPFFHAHLGPAEDAGHVCGDHALAVNHVHFPGEHGSSAGDSGRHAGLDHSSSETKPSFLLAEGPASAFPGPVLTAAAPPASPAPSLAPAGRLPSIAGVAIHDPPEPALPALRAPPTPVSH